MWLWKTFKKLHNKFSTLGYEPKANPVPKYWLEAALRNPNNPFKEKVQKYIDQKQKEKEKKKGNQYYKNIAGEIKKPKFSQKILQSDFSLPLKVGVQNSLNTKEKFQKIVLKNKPEIIVRKKPNLLTRRDVPTKNQETDNNQPILSFLQNMVNLY